MKKLFVCVFGSVLFFMYPVCAQPCEEDKILLCRSGYIDGCLVNNPDNENRRLTTDNVCVQKRNIPYSLKSDSCDVERHLLCLPTERDACQRPQVAKRHMCVLKSK